MKRQKRILKGDFSAITDDDVPGLLEYGLSSHRDGLEYTGPSGNTCTFKVDGNKLVIDGTCGVTGMDAL